MAEIHLQEKSGPLVRTPALLSLQGASGNIIGGLITGQGEKWLMEPDADLQRMVERMQRAEALSGTGSWDYIPATGSIWISEELHAFLAYPGLLTELSCQGAQTGSMVPGWEPLKQGFDSLIDPGSDFNILFSIDSPETSRKMINAAGALVVGSKGEKPRI